MSGESLPTEQDLFPAAEAAPPNVAPTAQTLPTEQDLFPTQQPKPPGFDWPGLGTSIAQGLGSFPSRVLDVGPAIATLGHPEKLIPPGGETFTQQYERHFGKPSHPLAAHIAATIPTIPFGPEFLGPEAAPIAKWLVNDVATNAGMNAGLTTADAAAEGRPVTSKEVKESAAGGGLTGGILGPALRGLGNLPGWLKVRSRAKTWDNLRKARQALENAPPDNPPPPGAPPSGGSPTIKLKAKYDQLRTAEQKAEEKLRRDWVKLQEQAKRKQLQEALKQETPKQPPAPPPAAEGVPAEPQTTREKAHELRKLGAFTDAERQAVGKLSKSMLDAKLLRDQAEYNYHRTVDALVEKGKEITGKAPNIRKPQPVVIDPETQALVRESAAYRAGVELKHVATHSDVSTIREGEGSASLDKYEPKGKTIKTLAAEAKFWKQRMDEHQAEYEKVRDSLGFKNSLRPGEAIKVPHTDKAGRVRNFTIEHRVQGRYKPEGTDEQIMHYNEVHKDLADEQREAEEARQIAQRANLALEPAWTKLQAYINHIDPDLGAALKGRKPIQADDTILKKAAQEGVLPFWRDMFKGLIEHDNQMRKALGVGLVVAGQVGNQKAEAKTTEEAQDEDLLTVGTGLTAAGALLLGGPAAAKALRKIKSLNLAGHVAWNIPAKTLFPAMRAGIKLQEYLETRYGKGGGQADAARWIQILTVTRANMDIIRREGNPLMVAQLEGLLNRWMKVMGGEHVIPHHGESIQIQQDFARSMVDRNHLATATLSPNAAINATRRQALFQLHSIKKQGAGLLNREMERLQRMVPRGKNNKAPWGQQSLYRVLRAEKHMNWEPSGDAKNWVDTALAAMAHGITEMVQLMAMGIHAAHALEGAASIGARYPVEYANGQRLLIGGNKTAKKFAASVNIKLPVYSNLEDTANPWSEAIARTVENVGNKVFGTGYANRFRAHPLVGGVREVASGSAIEQHAKVNIALVAASEKAAQHMNYPGGGNALRHDLTAWLNGNAHQASSAFNEAEGLRALGYIRAILDEGLAAGPAGYRVGLPIDRMALGAKGAARQLFAFVRTASIANRSQALLASDATRAIRDGNYVKAADATRAFFTNYAIIATVAGGAVVVKEMEDLLMQHGEFDKARQLHNIGESMAVVGRAPGAVGGALQHAGVKNDLHRFNFRMSHVQPTVEWLDRTGTPTIVQTGKNIKKLALGKGDAWQKTRAGLSIAANFGLSNIGETFSLERSRQILQAYADQQEKGGTVTSTYENPWMFGANELFESYQKPLGAHVPGYVNSHLIRHGSPLEAAIVKAVMPGEPEQQAEGHFNDLMESGAEGAFRTQFGQQAHDALSHFLNSQTPVKNWYEHNRRSRKNKQEENIPNKFAALEAEADKIFDFGGHPMKVSTFWQQAFGLARENPDWAHSLGK